MTAKELDGLFILAGAAIGAAVLILTDTACHLGPVWFPLYACATCGAYIVRHKRGR